MVEVTVKGLDVRLDEIKDHLQLDFEDLSEAGQIRLFTEYQETFLAEALGSQNVSVRKLAEKSLKNFSSEFLNRYIIELLKVKSGDDFVYSSQIKTILMDKNFKIQEQTIKKITEKGNKTIKNCMMIYHPETKSFLKGTISKNDDFGSDHKISTVSTFLVKQKFKK